MDWRTEALRKAGINPVPFPADLVCPGRKVKDRHGVQVTSGECYTCGAYTLRPCSHIPAVQGKEVCPDWRGHGVATVRLQGETLLSPKRGSDFSHSEHNAAVMRTSEQAERT